MSTLDTDEFDVTRPVEAPPDAEPPPTSTASTVPPQAPERAPAYYPEPHFQPPAPHYQSVVGVGAPAPPQPAGETSVVYVPLAVTIGDGFKFGCGFFLASAIVLAVLLVVLVLVGVVVAASGGRALPGV